MGNALLNGCSAMRAWLWMLGIAPNPVCSMTSVVRDATSTQVGRVSTRATARARARSNPAVIETRRLNPAAAAGTLTVIYRPHRRRIKVPYPT